MTHTVEVTSATLYEAAAQAVGRFRDEEWAADALTATAVLEVEVLLPPVSHRVPLAALRK